MKHSLKKEERLKKRKDIQCLFKEGQSFFEYPIKLYYAEKNECEVPLLFGVSVPRKKFKRAVDRNLLKRRIREAFRIHQIPLKDSMIKKGKCLMIMPVFVGEEIMEFSRIEVKIILLLQRLLRVYEQDS